jgi:hypothetical protein
MIQFFIYFNFTLDVDKKVFMHRHGILALLRAVAATTPAEIRELKGRGDRNLEKYGNKFETARK